MWNTHKVLRVVLPILFGVALLWFAVLPASRMAGQKMSHDRLAAAKALCAQATEGRPDTEFIALARRNKQVRAMRVGPAYAYYDFGSGCSCSVNFRDGKVTSTTTLC